MRPSFQCPKIECMNKSVPRETKPNKRWHFWMNSRKKRAMEITLIQNRDRKKCSMKKKSVHVQSTIQKSMDQIKKKPLVTLSYMLIYMDWIQFKDPEKTLTIKHHLNQWLLRTFCYLIIHEKNKNHVVLPRRP